MGRCVAGTFVLTLLLGACGSDDPGTSGAGAPDPTATTGSSADGPLPGERVEIYPYEGARLAVAGVAAGDTLNVRSGPGTDFDVVFELGPTAVDATATGHNRSVGTTGFWSEITAGDQTGWANAAFLLQPGQVADVTAALPPNRPRAKTMRDLARTVARLRAGGADPEPDIVVVDEPTAGDRGEIIVDLIGFGDDSVGGERLKILAERTADPESFTVRSVEATTMCRRGVTDDRLCV